jgi:hypothetical protein
MGEGSVRMSWAAAALAAMSAFGTPATAATFGVDGSLADWGVTVQNGTSYDTAHDWCSSQTDGSATCVGSQGGQHQTNLKFNSNGTIYGNSANPLTYRPNGTNTINGFNSNGVRFQLEDGIEGTAFGAPTPGKRIEDVLDTLTSGMVDPNNGGQDYDAEWMGTALKDNTLYIGILSGVRQDNGFSKYGPGDVRLVAHYADGSTAEFGLEVGGGAGNTSNTNVSINKGDVGSTYRLNSDGSTEKVLTVNGSGIETLIYNGGSSSTTSVGECSNGSGTGSGSGGGVSGGYGINEGQTAGTIWRMDQSDWILDPIAGTSSGAISPGGNTPVQIGCGAQKVGEADEFKFKQTSGSVHSVIELSLNLNLFGNFTDLDIYWGPACGNDPLGVQWPRETAEVPAPAALWLLGSALLTLGALRRRRRA